MPLNSSKSAQHFARLESTKHSVRKYLGIIALLVSLVLLSIFFTLQFNVCQALEIHLHEQAKAFFSEIVVVRQWVAQHGGVYVPLDKTTGINPYLAQIDGVQSTLSCAGKAYALKNPSLVTKELSELPGRSELVRYKMTSLHPLNPDNAPDAFETSALQRFEHGEGEVGILEKNGTSALFRYMAPLVTDQSCLSCHARQGYAVGDIRGGIVVSVKADDLVAKIKQARLFMVLAGIGLLGLLIASIWFISRFFIRDLHQAQETLERMATTDYLTGLVNRRTGIQTLERELARASRAGTPLCVAIMDLDHFKRVNDTYGHNVGDELLQKFSAILREHLRQYDTPCRHGGEEFLLIMPQTTLGGARSIVLRILHALHSTPLSTAKGDIPTSMSAGVIQTHDGENADHCIERADTLLYQAKRDGRGRICG